MNVGDFGVFADIGYEQNAILAIPRRLDPPCASAAAKKCHDATFNELLGGKDTSVCLAENMFCGGRPAYSL